MGTLLSAPDSVRMTVAAGRTISKRDGRVVRYDAAKIGNAIAKAFAACRPDDAGEAWRLTGVVDNELLQRFGDASYNIEDIQDLVETVLMDQGFKDVAKRYIIYRDKRTKMREANTSLMRSLDEITNVDASKSDLKRDNANVDGNTAMGSMLQLGSAAAKAYNSAHLLTKEQYEAHHEGWIHIHDFEFYSLTTTCCQIDVDALFENGFSTGHGFLREPQDIQSYAALACIAIQSNQNDQHGGQSIPNFDYALGKGVVKTYERLFAENLRKFLLVVAPAMGMEKEELASFIGQARLATETGPSLTLDAKFSAALAGLLGHPEAERLVRLAAETALQETERRTYQAMEAVVHNLNSMHSRAGAQTPFSSINYGTDTSPEGRMVIKNILLATDAGLGHGETPIFPIQVFKLKDGVNYRETDPNYDLFKLACQVSAKRLFPNFTNLDAPFNIRYYQKGRPETEVATMGCRTRVIANRNDPDREVSFGRGNLSFTSINLPRLAIEANGDEEKFFAGLDKMLKLVAQQLLDRLDIQSKKKVKNFPFLMGQGVWMDSDKLQPDDCIGEVLKHGTLTIGFIGLAEALKALYGKHHGECDEAQRKGLAIVKHMHVFTQNKGAETGLNFTLIATPAEGLSGRFVRMDKKRYGVLEGITDRDYYTNSFHVPVYYRVPAYDKIRIEAPYHALTPGGHITYVELDGDTAQNVEAFMAVIQCMHDEGIGYGSINHPVDRDPVCGYVGVIGDVCPRCGRREGEAVAPERMRQLMKMFPDLRESIKNERTESE